LGRISGYLKQKQPKIFVWISAVGGKGILQRSQTIRPLNGVPPFKLYHIIKFYKVVLFFLSVFRIP